VVSLVVAGAGGLVLMGAEPGEIYCTGDSCELGIGLIAGAGILYATGTVVEMVSAPLAARAHNRRLAIAPVAAPGLTLSGTF
jgi:hypothetical protein